MAAGSIVVDLLMKTGSFETDTQRAAKSLKRFEKDAKEVSKTVAGYFKEIGAAFAAFAGANTLDQFIRNTINGLDALNDMADATGSTVEKMSALENIALRTGTQVETATSAVVKLNAALSDAAPGSKYAEIFNAIGLSVEELKAMDPADALMAVANALAGFADDGNKARVVQELFGKSVKEVAPLLKDLADNGTLVATVTKEQAAQAEAFNKQLFDLQANFTAISRDIVGMMLPSLNKYMEVVKRAREETGYWASTLQFLAKFAASPAFAVVSQLSQQPRSSREVVGVVTGPEPAALPSLNLPEPTAPVRTQRTSVISSRKREEEEFAAWMRKLQEGQNEWFMLLEEKRAREKRKKEEDYQDWMAQLRQGEVDQQARIVNRQFDEAARIFEQTRTPLEQFNAEQYKLNNLLKIGAINWDTYNRAIGQAKENLDAAGASTDKSKQAAQELGFTFSSAFEDAIIAGKSLSDTLRGLAQDILRIAARRLITEPLGNAISGAISEGMKYFGGARAGGGDVIGGRSYLVGENGPEMFTPRTTGTITPNSSVSGSTIVQNINVTTGVQQTVRAEIMSLMPQIAGAAKAAVADAKLRGGSYAAALR